MTVTIPFRLPLFGTALAPEVQADFDALISALDSLSIVGDLTITGAGKGIILTTPDGLHTWRLAVDNSGNPTTEQIT